MCLEEQDLAVVPVRKTIELNIKFLSNHGSDIFYRTGFNWKQRKQLGLDQPRVENEVNEYYGANFNELLKLDKFKNGEFVDITDVDEITIGGERVEKHELHADHPWYKTVNVSLLYGNHVKCAPAYVRHVKQPFSHTRVFGKKKDVATASQSSR